MPYGVVIWNPSLFFLETGLLVGIIRVVRVGRKENSDEVIVAVFKTHVER